MRLGIINHMMFQPLDSAESAYPLKASRNALSSASASGVVPLSCPSMSTRSAVLLAISLLVRLILATISVSGTTSSSSKVSS